MRIRKSLRRCSSWSCMKNISCSHRSQPLKSVTKVRHSSQPILSATNNQPPKSAMTASLIESSERLPCIGKPYTALSGRLCREQTLWAQLSGVDNAEQPRKGKERKGKGGKEGTRFAMRPRAFRKDRKKQPHRHRSSLNL
eukprot:1158202-Pelagomonas_calceolata.AAC.2